MINDIRVRMSWIGSGYIGDTLDTLGIPYIHWMGREDKVGSKSS